MIQIQKTDREKLEVVSSLFKGWDDTMIWSCLEGEMGAVYVSDKMLSAKLEIGDFCFLAVKRMKVWYITKKEIMCQN